uniref:Immunoglobulin V-set domain-containing protein n=1 Tax=Pundamilia nyererei TaxID=303518 RepID=A0A3B4GFB5_9CICH
HVLVVGTVIWLLFMCPTAEGKKLFLWREVLVRMDRSLLPEGRCPQNNDGYAGMYLYHNFIEQKEVYFYGNYANSKIIERPRYEGRIESNGAPMNHNITISNLTVDDSGVYTCVYKESADKSVNCNVHTVFVRGEFLFFPHLRFVEAATFPPYLNIVAGKDIPTHSVLCV